MKVPITLQLIRASLSSQKGLTWPSWNAKTPYVKLYKSPNQLIIHTNKIKKPSKKATINGKKKYNHSTINVLSWLAKKMDNKWQEVLLLNMTDKCSTIHLWFQMFLSYKWNVIMIVSLNGLKLKNAWTICKCLFHWQRLIMLIWQPSFDIF